MKNRLFSVLLSVVLVSALMAGCGQESPKEEKADKGPAIIEEVEEAADSTAQAVMETSGEVADSAEEAIEEAAGESGEELLTAEGKRVEPLPAKINLSNPEDGIYPVTIQNISGSEGEVQLQVKLYTEDLYDAVEITTLAAGDVIVINGVEMPVEKVEKGNPVDLGDGFQSVYVVNGGLMEGGADFIAHEGGTFRYFGYDDHATYTEQGSATLTMAENGVFNDLSDLATPDGIKISASELVDFYEEDEARYFIPQNTTIRVENGKVVEINRIFIP